TLREDRQRLEVVEARVAEVSAPRLGAAVGHEVAAEQTLGSLDRRVHLASGNGEALRHQLEVVDERLHRLAHDVANVVKRVALAVGTQRELSGPRNLLVGNHDGLSLELLEAVGALLDDLERLVALLE